MGNQPTVWVLLGLGAGGNAQMLRLAEALDWPFATKHLVHNPLYLIPNALVGPTLLTLNHKRSTPLLPPWPDLVIAASRRSVPVALWIRAQSQGRTRLVHLFHTMAPLHWFDLIITTPQYGLPHRDNVLQILAPLNRIPQEQIDEVSRPWKARLSYLPRPWLVLLVGGSSSNYFLGAAVAQRLGRQAAQMAAEQGGSVLISTSPRTSPAATEALFKAVPDPAYRYRWRRDDPDNPYLALLGLADSFMVTADSASQVIEASLTGKPVTIFDWPLRPAHRYGPALMSRCLPVRWLETLVEVGLIKPPRDFNRYHALLRERGLLSEGGASMEAVTSHKSDLDQAVDAIHSLFPASRA